jgi:hypothetical protein
MQPLLEGDDNHQFGNGAHKKRAPTDMENPPPDQENLHMRLSRYRAALMALDLEREQLLKHIESLKAERRVLEAVARKIARQPTAIEPQQL